MLRPQWFSYIDVRNKINPLTDLAVSEYLLYLDYASFEELESNKIFDDTYCKIFISPDENFLWSEMQLQWTRQKTKDYKPLTLPELAQKNCQTPEPAL